MSVIITALKISVNCPRATYVCTVEAEAVSLGTLISIVQGCFATKKNIAGVVLGEHILIFYFGHKNEESVRETIHLYDSSSV